MKNAGRPLGSRIREVLAVLEKTGEATVTEMRIWLPHIERSNLSKYCRRAARRGLITIKGDHPMRFTAAAGWRELVDARPEAIAKAKADERVDTTALAIRARPALQTIWGAS